MNQEFECLVHDVSEGYCYSECRNATGESIYREIRTDAFLEHERLEVKEGTVFRWTIQDGRHEMRITQHAKMGRRVYQ
jgi:hypothetical protein